MYAPEHTLVGRLGGAIDGHVEVSQVVVMRSGRDALDSTATEISLCPSQYLEKTHGSFISRSVSLIMRLGRAMAGDWSCAVRRERASRLYRGRDGDCGAVCAACGELGKWLRWQSHNAIVDVWL